jgi:DNA-binding MarR family transcriptional regulator
MLCVLSFSVFRAPNRSFMETIFLPEPLPIEDHIVAAIRRIIRAIDIHSRRLVAEHGLTGPQLATLREVARLDGASAGALARAVNLSHPTVTGILDRLEKRGLVSRLRSGTDRRSVNVYISDTGRALLTAAPSLLQDHFCSELARLEDWEQTTMLAVLQRIASMMDAEGIAAAAVLSSEHPLVGAAGEHESGTSGMGDARAIEGEHAFDALT